MKTLAYCSIAVLAVGCANAQTNLPSNEWKATLKIVDETGQPVAGAETWVSYYVSPPPDERVASAKISGLSDTNGMFTASHRDQSYYLGFHARKAGHYSTMIRYELGFPFQYDSVKWNPTATLLLKTIRHPIPMYAKQVNLGMPVFEKPAGFDLIVGDWIAPYGKGKHADIIFTAEINKRAGDDSDYKLMVSFPKSGDGIQDFLVTENDRRSGLMSPHEAPLDGYQPEWIQTSIRRSGLPVKSNRDSNRNYFFRVQTVLDEKGQVKSALYGKIYGDFMQFRYYLNPTPNDRNIEFDPKQNLLKGLKSTERVEAP